MTFIQTLILFACLFSLGAQALTAWLFYHIGRRQGVLEANSQHQENLLRMAGEVIEAGNAQVIQEIRRHAPDRTPRTGEELPAPMASRSTEADLSRPDEERWPNLKLVPGMKERVAELDRQRDAINAPKAKA